MTPEYHTNFFLLASIDDHCVNTLAFKSVISNSVFPSTLTRRYHFISSVYLLRCVRLFVTPWSAAHQAFLSITNSQSPLKLMSVEPVMPSNHLILCRPLLLLPSIFPSIRAFSNEVSSLHQVAKSFSFSISPSNEYSGLISLGWTGWISLQSKRLSRVFCNTTVQKYQFFSTELSL